MSIFSWSFINLLSGINDSHSDKLKWDIVRHVRAWHISCTEMVRASRIVITSHQTPYTLRTFPTMGMSFLYFTDVFSWHNNTAHVAEYIRVSYVHATMCVVGWNESWLSNGLEQHFMSALCSLIQVVLYASCNRQTTCSMWTCGKIFDRQIEWCKLIVWS